MIKERCPNIRFASENSMTGKIRQSVKEPVKGQEGSVEGNNYAALSWELITSREAWNQESQALISALQFAIHEVLKKLPMSKYVSSSTECK